MVTKKDLTKLTKELTKVVKESMRGGKATAAERVAAEKAVEVAVNYPDEWVDEDEAAVASHGVAQSVA